MTENILPEEIKSLYDKASMAVDQRNYDYAIELLIRAIKIKPDFAKGRQLLRLAEIRHFDEHTPNILVLIVIRLFSLIRMFIASMVEMSRKHHDAMVLYEKILEIDPKNTLILTKLGNLLKVEGMKEAAAVTLETAVNVSAKNVLAYELLGELCSDLGNYDRARVCFKKVLELKPHDANAEKGLKNLDALTTIDKSFDKKDAGNLRIREIKE